MTTPRLSWRKVTECTATLEAQRAAVAEAACLHTLSQLIKQISADYTNTVSYAYNRIRWQIDEWPVNAHSLVYVHVHENLSTSLTDFVRYRQWRPLFSINPQRILSSLAGHSGILHMEMHSTTDPVYISITKLSDTDAVKAGLARLNQYSQHTLTRIVYEHPA